MPPRAFPFPLSIGIDICHVPRIRSLISKRSTRNGREEASIWRFLDKVLTHREKNIFFGSYNKSMKEGQYERLAVHLGGRWAAKEAAIKACKYRDLTFMDIEILTSLSSGGRSGAPFGLVRDVPGSTRRTEENRAEWVGIPMHDPFGRDLGDIPKHLSLSSRQTSTPKRKVAGLEARLGQLEGQLFQVSISHEADYTTAVAMIPDLRLPQDAEEKAGLRESDEMGMEDLFERMERQE